MNENRDIQKGLFDKLLNSAAYIDKMSRSGAANYIITSGQVSQAISELWRTRVDERKAKIRSMFDEDRA
jgi:hypothetical protein